MPPVVVVILATLLAVVVWLPTSQWRALATEAVSSTFYVQNWHLIALATDYLDAQRAPSPFQHFWSLSVEEQYYIVWPFVVGLLGWVAVRTRRRPSLTYAVGFGVLVLASLVASVTLTFSNPAAAYFSTFTRMWELGLGSLLAAVFPALTTRLHAHTGLRVSVMWAGLLGILVSVLVITESTPFPGWAALLPTVATALVILADDPAHRANPRVILASRPVQLVGDTSYALYLWHWPIVTIAPVALGAPLTTGQKLVILVLSLVVAWLSTRFVEHPVRTSALLRRGTWRVFLVGAVTSLLVVGASSGLGFAVTRSEQQTRSELQAMAGTVDHCFGAPALDPANHCPASTPLVTTPAFAKADISDGIRSCLNWPPYPQLTSCTRGTTTDPSKRIALLGNSHAGHWLPALDELGARNGWRVDTYLEAVCLPIDAVEPFTVGINGVGAADLTRLCQTFADKLVGRIEAGHYDLVVVAAMDRAVPTYRASYERLLRRLVADGLQVVVIRDTPAPSDRANETPDCVGRHLADTAACNGTPQAWIGQDPLTDAAIAVGGPQIRRIDVNSHLCSPTVCPAVIGGVITYADINHLTTTMVKSLEPYLEPTLVAALAAGRHAKA